MSSQKVGILGLGNVNMVCGDETPVCAPSWGTITPLAPVSNVPGDPSALSNFVASWEVINILIG